MSEVQLGRLDLNLLVTFAVLMDTGRLSGAAEKLGKTPSTVSHALARLREQMGDPLLVKVGGRVLPSPHALTLIDEIRPILRSIHRVVSPPHPFDPATSARAFRIAVPAIPGLINEVFARLADEGPGIALEWAGLGPHLYTSVADEQIDLALLGADNPLPQGLMEQLMPPLERFTFLRQGHPALATWGKGAWLDWPNVMLGLSNAARQTVEDRLARDDLHRRIRGPYPGFLGDRAATGTLEHAGDQREAVPGCRHGNLWSGRAPPARRGSRTSARNAPQRPAEPGSAGPQIFQGS